MRLLPILVIAAPSVLVVVLQWRISRYRKDRESRLPGSSPAFDSLLLPSDVLSGDMYTEGGRRPLLWLRVAYVLAGISWIVGMALLAAQANS